MLILYWIDKISSIVKSVNFDVVTSETHDAAMVLTQHPVEEGSDIVDHARAEPKKLSIEGYVSNKPLFSNLFANPLTITTDSQLLAFQATQLKIPKKEGGAPLLTPGGLTSAVTSAVGSLLNGPPQDKAFLLRSNGSFPNRALLIYELLEEARTKVALISVITAFGTIENMAVVKNTIPRTPEDGNGAKFQVELQQLRIVKSKTVQAPVAAESRAKKEVESGSKNAKAGEKGKEEARSWAKAISDATTFTKAGDGR